MKSTLCVAAFLALAGPLGAQTRPTGDCAGFQRVVHASEKALAMLEVEGLGDNSAPRATMREQRIANELQTIRLNVELMIHHRCPVPAAPISESTYLANTLRCALDRRNDPSVDSPPSCEMSRWTPERADSTSAASPNPRR